MTINKHDKVFICSLCDRPTPKAGCYRMPSVHGVLPKLICPACVREIVADQQKPLIAVCKRALDEICDGNDAKECDDPDCLACELSKAIAKAES